MEENKEEKKEQENSVIAVIEKPKKEPEKEPEKAPEKETQNLELQQLEETQRLEPQQLEESQNPEPQQLEEGQNPDTKQLEENQTTSKEKKKIKLGIILVIAVILIIIGLLFSTIFAIINMRKETIAKEVYINQFSVSNMTKDVAKTKLENIYSEKEENEIYLKYGEFETTTTYKALEVKYKIDEAIEEAYQIGREGNLFKDNFSLLRTRISGTQIKLDIELDEEMLNQIIQNINNSIEGAVVQSSYYINDDGDKLIITPGKEGFQADEQQLYQKIYQIIKEDDENNTIEIPLITVQPAEIDIEKIRQEIYKEAQDAYYTQNPFTIHPESEGIDFDIENAKLLLAEEKEQYEIPLIITKPTKTTQDIGEEAFPDLLASYSTNYQESNVDRSTNLKLASKKINGTVLLPGEEFSYNKVVGKRTTEAGFRPAAVYNAGRIENGIGGGICQISSTLYDAVVMANLEVTVRRNHQFTTSYAKPGTDATVSWGTQDFKFKNSRTYPIRITATSVNGVATIQIWGVKEEVEYDITIETKKTATIPFETQYVQDASLPAGQQKVVQSGWNGQKVEAYKVTRLNGQVISTTLLSKDSYRAMKQIVHVGTGQ